MQIVERMLEGHWRVGYAVTMFLFFSNRLGCLTSIVISIILSALLMLLLRGCSGPLY
jgi:hypothetical protein